MPDKSITLFDWEVLALADGRMSMKRVPVKPQPKHRLIEGLAHVTVGMNPADDGAVWYDGDCVGPGREVRAPYRVGDKLWVKEAWSEMEVDDVQGERIFFKADDPLINGRWKIATWRPASTMPRYASRYTIVVTEVTPPELVQEISAFDCFCEGCPKEVLANEGHYPNNRFGWCAKQWDSDYARRRGMGWNDNPWVFPFKFEVKK